MHTIATLVGLALVAIAVGALAGPWWGVLVAGIVLAGGGVLGASADLIAAPREPGKR